MALVITLSASKRLTQDWRRDTEIKTRSTTGKGKAIAYAKAHGYAGILRMDGSYIAYYYDGQKIYQKTYKEIRISD